MKIRKNFINKIKICIVLSVVTICFWVNFISVSAASSEYIFEDSSYNKLDNSDVAEMTKEELQMAINEIYARHGRLFKDSSIQEYFDQKDWYIGYVEPEAFDTAVFNEVEKWNISFLAGWMNNVNDNHVKKISETPLASNNDKTKVSKKNSENLIDSVWSTKYLKSYLEENKIKLCSAANNADQICNSIYSNQEWVPIKIESKFFRGEYYALTEQTSNYYYAGDIKDNKPDGKGCIIKIEEDLNDSIYRMVYIGEFKEGKYQGLGRLYESEKLTDPERALVEEADNMQDMILEIFNPIIYMGEFENGKESGEGAAFAFESVDIWLDKISPKSYKIDISGCEILMEDVRNILITVGDFKNDMANGRTKIYHYGMLFYDGEVEDDAIYGTGTVYYEKSKQICYEGELKGGKPDGEGTKYDENGNIIYSGKWDMGDYAS